MSTVTVSNYEKLEEGSSLNELMGKPATKEEVVAALIKDKEGIPSNIQDTLSDYCSAQITDEEWAEIEKVAYMYPLVEVKTDLTELDVMNMYDGGQNNDEGTRKLIGVLASRPADRAKILTSLDYAIRSGLKDVVDLSDPSKAIEQYEKLQIPLEPSEETKLKKLLEKAEKKGNADVIKFRLHISTDNQPFSPGLVRAFLALNNEGQSTQIANWNESLIKPKVTEQKNEKILFNSTKLESVRKRVDSLSVGAQKALEGGLSLITNPEPLLKFTEDVDSKLALEGGLIAVAHQIADLLDHSENTARMPENQMTQLELSQKIALLNTLKLSKDGIDLKRIIESTNLGSKFKGDGSVNTIFVLLEIEKNIYSDNDIDNIVSMSKEVVTSQFEQSFMQSIVAGRRHVIIDETPQIADRPGKIVQLLQRAVLFNSAYKTVRFNSDNQTGKLSELRFVNSYLAQDYRTRREPSALKREGLNEEAKLALAINIIEKIELNPNELAVKDVLKTVHQTYSFGSTSLEGYTELEDGALEIVEIYFDYKQKHDLAHKETFNTIIQNIGRPKYDRSLDPRRVSVFTEQVSSKLSGIGKTLQTFKAKSVSVMEQPIAQEQVSSDVVEISNLTAEQISNLTLGLQFLNDPDILGRLHVLDNAIASEGTFRIKHPKLDQLKALAKLLGIDEFEKARNGAEEEIETRIVEKILPNPDELKIETLDQASVDALKHLIDTYEIKAIRRNEASGNTIELKSLTDRFLQYKIKLEARKQEIETENGGKNLAKTVAKAEATIIGEDAVKIAYTDFLKSVGVEV